MTNLRQLSLFLRGHRSNDEPVGDERDMTLAGVWNCLLQFKDQLEYLDIYPEDSFRFTPTSDEGEFCPPLPEFTKLRYLSIAPRVLLGHKCEHDSPNKFRNHLPPHILSIFLYTRKAFGGSPAAQSLGDGLDLLYGKVRLCATELEGIVIQGAENGLRVIAIGSEDSGMIAPILLTKLRKATMKYGIRFIDNLESHIFNGGQKAPFVIASRENTPLSVARAKVRESRMGEVIPWPLRVFHCKGRLGALDEKELA
ncbi:hypothetical protein BDV06DRAFT_46713 [Aspergillus oleicola]